ncbi:hypothetical protein [Jeongeupia chitinilytica]|uniref:Uncharacterized protein n=1 Tax=Jeongeupia chitinilytica TaxID=1041641 RepID=A0ABQ3GZ52_9NEIS|nr:hypothetical protein [Jeongeupia chitinilytica]GHD59429.1 hypothetical protein GCM10007350_10890 [Jeongeupia chitinilytica]
MVYEEKPPVEGLHMKLDVRKGEPRKQPAAPAAERPATHRVDVSLQKPFDPAISDLYDPDRPPDDVQPA